MNYLNFYSYRHDLPYDSGETVDELQEPNATIIGARSPYSLPELTGVAFRAAVTARQAAVQERLKARKPEPIDNDTDLAPTIDRENDQSLPKVLFRVVANEEMVQKPHKDFSSRIERIVFPSESKKGPNRYAIGNLALLVMPPLTEREEADLESAFRMALAGTGEANERFDTSEVEQVIMDEMQKDPEATAKMPPIHDV